MFKNPAFHFEDHMKERAQRLHERWEAQNWGKGEVVEENTDDETNDSAGEDA